MSLAISMYKGSFLNGDDANSTKLDDVIDAFNNLKVDDDPPDESWFEKVI